MSSLEAKKSYQQKISIDCITKKYCTFTQRIRWSQVAQTRRDYRLQTAAEINVTGFDGKMPSAVIQL